ncbi:GFA family protein [Bosea sp. TAF32]|uniref:GFA family protein n=1 Tax=Bosea sp. TAF32 TaxID=3237482 RepID=UPI003F90147E
MEIVMPPCPMPARWPLYTYGCRAPPILSEKLRQPSFEGRMNRMAIRERRCSCGQLRVACQGEPAIVALCHCRECQMRTGSAYGVAALFAREAIVTSGGHADYNRPADSGLRVPNHFCPRCGSTVFWESSRRPELRVVAVVAFADPDSRPRRRVFFEQHRHPGRR